MTTPKLEELEKFLEVLRKEPTSSSCRSLLTELEQAYWAWKDANGYVRVTASSGYTVTSSALAPGAWTPLTGNLVLGSDTTHEEEVRRQEEIAYARKWGLRLVDE